MLLHCLSLSILIPLSRSLSGTISVKSFHVVSAIRMRFATTQITQNVHNLARTPQEYDFVAYIPEAAFVSNFSMQVGDYVSIATVEERQSGANVYEMIHQTRKSIADAPMQSQAFASRVVLGGESEMTFVLTYEEVLERRHGVYRSLIPVAPAEEIPDMRIHVRVLERGRISRRKLKVPPFSLDAGLRTNAQLLSMADEPRARVRPSLSRQVSAVDITFKPKGPGQFVLLYDLDRDQDAGLMEISDGYFVHFIAPPPGRRMEPGSKNVVFLLDTSASMANKWADVLTGMEMILSQIGPADVVNFLLFNGRVSAWQLQSLPANAAAKADALQFLRSAKLSGMTDLKTALGIAVDLLRVDKSAAMVNQLFLVTDTKHNGENSGRRKEAELLELLGTLNPGGALQLSAVALGKDAHLSLLRRLAAANRGTARLVHLGRHASSNIQGFFSEVATPLLADLRVKYASAAVELPFLVSQQGTQTRDYFLGNEILLAGKINVSSAEARSFRVAVQGRNARGRELSFRSLAQIRPTQADSEDKFVRRIWAFLTLKGLLRVSEEGGLGREMKARVLADATRLAIQHSYVTPVTALNVVPLEVDWGQGAPEPTTALPPSPQQLILIPPDSDPLRELVLSLEKGFNPLLFSQASQAPKPFTTPSPVVGGRPIAAMSVPLRDLKLIQTDDEPEAPRLEAEKDPMTEMELNELSDFFNPGLFSGSNPHHANMSAGPVVGSLQAYPRLQEGTEPGLMHYMHATEQWIDPCGYGDRVDVVFAVDVSSEDVALAGPGLRFILTQLLQRLLATVALTQQETRVGLLAFAGDPESGSVVYRLNQNQNPNALVHILDKTDQSSIPDQTQNIFRLGYRLFRESPNRGARRAMVVLSNRNDFARYQSVVAKVRSAGLAMYAISPNQRDGRILAGLRELVGGDESRVFTEPNPAAIAAEFC